MRFGRDRNTRKRQRRSLGRPARALAGQQLENRVFLHAATVLTEVLSNPAAPSASELELVPAAVSTDFQFIEFVNKSDKITIPLLGSKVSGDIVFDLPDENLEPGEYAVVVSDETAFQARYGDAIRILGEWTGALDTVMGSFDVIDETEQLLLHFSQSDTSRWNNPTIRLGTSYELKDVVNSPQAETDNPARWQTSLEVGGSPGAINSTKPGIFIGEILANSDDATVDAIEISNPTKSAIDISGFWLSNDQHELQKYQFPEMSVIAAGEYLVVDESAWNPNPAEPAPGDFDLDGIQGGEIWLTNAPDAMPVQFVDVVEFASQRENQSDGRIPGSNGFVPLNNLSLGQPNGPSFQSEVVISEFLYDPGLPSLDALTIDPELRAADLAFVEIYNSTDSDFDFSKAMLAGDIQFEVSPATTLAAHEMVVVVSFDPSAPEFADRTAAFREHFQIDETVVLIGGFTGQLANRYGDLRLTNPGLAPEADPEFIPQHQSEVVFFDALAPWEFHPGESLQRISKLQDPNLASSWTSVAPSPGASDLVPPPPDPPLVTEVMHSPRGPSPDELLALPDAVASNFEFIEVYNPNEVAISLLGFSISGDVAVDLPDELLMPDEYAVLVSDSAAFENRYGESVRILAQWDGSELPSSPTLKLSQGAEDIREFQLSTNRRWPSSVHEAGASLELKADDLDPSLLSSWQASTQFHGTPAQAHSTGPNVVINEVYANSDELETNAIELFNPSDDVIDISGWFVSDSSDNLLKYRIPDATTIDPNSYAIIVESDFDPNPPERGPDDFSLDGDRGGQIWLSIAVDEEVTTLVDNLEFGANVLGKSTSRIPNGVGSGFPNTAPTIGQENSIPDFGPLLVSEIHYEPESPSSAAIEIFAELKSDDLQFVEIFNAADEPTLLQHHRLAGDLQKDFGDTEVIASNKHVVLVTFDPDLEANALKTEAFRAHYGIGDAVPLLGASGSLVNDFGFLQVLMAGEPLVDDPEFRPSYLNDEVQYDALAPWMFEFGKSISRVAEDAFGNDPGSWNLTTASPGRSDLAPQPLAPPVITEIMYAPRAATTEELEAIPDLEPQLFSFVEILNPNPDFSLNLEEYRITGDISFDPAAQTIDPGEYVVVVANTNAFRLRYGDEIRVVGEWTGDLPLADVTLNVSTMDDQVVSETNVDFNSRWPVQAGGFGSSLELLDANLTHLSSPYQWQSSFVLGGTPGAEPTQAPGIVINEVLANSGSESVDFVELYNPTDDPIDVSGWYLSESGLDLAKYAIPDATMIDSKSYLVVDELNFFPTPEDPQPSHFLLDGIHGGGVWLSKMEAESTSIIDSVHFGSQQMGQSWGRIPDQSGPLFPQQASTPNAANVDAPMDTIVVSEILYNAGDPSEDALAIDPDLKAADLAFVELYNPSEDEPVALTDWLLSGDIDFVFGDSSVIAPEGTLVLVNFDPNVPESSNRIDAFKTHHGVTEISFAGPMSGHLRDDFGLVSLLSAAEAPEEEPEFIPHLLLDQVAYDGLAPWPENQLGTSLSRLDVNSFGSDVTSWESAAPSPGSSRLKPPPELLLPDLTPWVDPRLGFNQFEYLDRHAATDHLLMRFATATANIGQGPLIIQGRDPVEGGGLEVVQLILDDEGKFSERPAGEFVFHPTHDHIHFDDYARYNLREVTEEGEPGEIVASGEKISFCLIDFAPFDLGLSGAPQTFVFTLCDGGTQGISAGWADIYSADLDDQWIDIEDVPPGDYWFETILDPNDRLMESDETNNIFATKVTLGVPEYEPDRLDAAEINSLLIGTGDHVLDELSIHTPGDIDTFRWIAPATGDLNIELEFDFTLGDIDLYVWGPGANNFPLSVFSTLEGNSESAELEVIAGKTYTIVAKEFSGQTNPSYTLTIDGPEIEPDQYESNDVFLMATDLGTEDQQITANAHRPGDRDYFAWTATETGDVYAEVSFAESEGNLEFVVYDFFHNLIFETDKQLNQRSLLFSVVEGEAYLFAILAGDNDYSAGYDLQIDFLEIPEDAQEPNDTFDRAVAIGPGDVEIQDLSIHQEENHDFYEWTPTVNGPAEFKITFSHEQGDLGLNIWMNGEIVEQVNSVDDDESITLIVTTEDQIVIEVFGTAGVTNSNYQLSVRESAPPVVLAARIGGRDRGRDFDLVNAQAELRPIPWHNVDRLEVQFSKNVLILESDWEFLGDVYSNADFAFHYSSDTFIATWTTEQPFVEDRIAFSLFETITDTFLNPLDGDWSGSSPLPSGNGTAGGDFSLVLDILPGDLSRDGLVDIADINALAFGMEAQDDYFDMNGDQEFDIGDIAILVVEIMGTFIGDSDLDGRFDSKDLILIFQAGQFEDETPDNSTWVSGDWDLDGDFNTKDLVFAFQFGGYENNAVPKPVRSGPKNADLAAALVFDDDARKR